MVWSVVMSLTAVLRTSCIKNNISIGAGHSFWTGLPSNEINRKGPAFYVLAVENAGWEHVKKFDVGFDMSLFNQLNITF